MIDCSNEIPEELRGLPVEPPDEPCIDCIYAGWIDMYGTVIFGCDMHYYCMADEAELW